MYELLRISFYDFFLDNLIIKLNYLFNLYFLDLLLRSPLKNKMGKKQHQSDKMYLTATEWKNFFGGKKDDLQSLKDLSDFRRLPFYCCCLSFQPFTFPYCSPDGTIFDLENIIPFLKKYGI